MALTAPSSPSYSPIDLEQQPLSWCLPVGTATAPPSAGGYSPRRTIPAAIVRYYVKKALDQTRRTRPEDPDGRVRAVAEDIAAVRRHLLPELDAELRDALIDADRAPPR
ncbi:hypothetical protein [Streptomyces sp. NPDC058603]|uniref:hypothetical protein n=1 Tax=Streptomyces sp. NPDC058603 TaxID=3346551 RepID=UPI00364F7FDA